LMTALLTGRRTPAPGSAGHRNVWAVKPSSEEEYHEEGGDAKRSTPRPGNRGSDAPMMAADRPRRERPLALDPRRRGGETKGRAGSCPVSADSVTDDRMSVWRWDTCDSVGPLVAADMCWHGDGVRLKRTRETLSLPVSVRPGALVLAGAGAETHLRFFATALLLAAAEAKPGGPRNDGPSPLSRATPVRVPRYALRRPSAPRWKRHAAAGAPCTQASDVLGPRHDPPPSECQVDSSAIEFSARVFRFFFFGRTSSARDGLSRKGQAAT